MTSKPISRQGTLEDHEEVDDNNNDDKIDDEVDDEVDEDEDEDVEDEEVEPTTIYHKNNTTIITLH